MSTIDLSINWQSALKILLVVLEDGNKEGKKKAKEELITMAKVADLAAEQQKTRYTATQIESAWNRFGDKHNRPPKSKEELIKSLTEEN